MMFMEQAAYVGDVLSFYLDNQIQENFLQYARQPSNIFDLAYMYGYTPKVTGLATTIMDFYQQVPSKLVNGETVPDFSYAVYVNANTVITNQGGSQAFTIEEPIDFTVSSSLDPTTITVAQVSNNLPVYYLLAKRRKAFSGNINTKTVSFGAPQEFATNCNISW